METIAQHLNSTVLNDRILWYDGDSSYLAHDILKLTKQGIDVRWVDQITPNIQTYNALSSTPIKVKTECTPFDQLCC